MLCPLHTTLTTVPPVQRLVQELEGVLNEKEEVVTALQREVLFKIAVNGPAIGIEFDILFVSVQKHSRIISGERGTVHPG